MFGNSNYVVVMSILEVCIEVYWKELEFFE